MRQRAAIRRPLGLVQKPAAVRHPERPQSEWLLSAQSGQLRFAVMPSRRWTRPVGENALYRACIIAQRFERYAVGVVPGN